MKPIKRSLALQPLSREHHEGLQFAWKLRQGLKDGVDTDRLSAFTGWYWKYHIRPHFFQEEKILTAYLSDHPLVVRMKNEHQDIVEHILDIDRDPLRYDLAQLADLVERHIRFEERELFPYVEENLSPDLLSNVQLQLEKCDVCNEEWKDEFWKRA